MVGSSLGMILNEDPDYGCFPICVTIPAHTTIIELETYWLEVGYLPMMMGKESCGENSAALPIPTMYSGVECVRNTILEFTKAQ